MPTASPVGTAHADGLPRRNGARRRPSAGPCGPEGTLTASPCLPAQGDEDNHALYPPLQSGNAIPGAVRVGSYSPHGDSPFGVADLVGNVWQ